ncbi:hypothetical protein KJ652_06735 [Patescibacteria group bacterium]|nr:hypothetical protein [Patescibacteria group bacterium]
MQIPPLSFIVLDTETTGFIPRVNRIIEFAGVRIQEGKVTAEYESLFSIPTKIPETVQVLTRIKSETVAGKPLFEDKREEMTDFIGKDTLIIGQNVSFDIGMLKGEGIDLSDHPWIDTAMLASLVYPELRSYSLGYVSNVLKLKHEPVHRAMGDVNATLELLSKCWQRLQELPPELYEVAQMIMSKSSPSYQMLFEALPEPTAKAQPKWLTITKPKLTSTAKVSPLAQSIFQKPASGEVMLIEEPIAPTTMQQLLDSAVADEDTVHWIAVKNLEAALRRLTIPDGVRVLYPPHELLDISAAGVFAQQDEFTADESSLAVKMAWYEPQTFRSAPIHGEERGVWNGKLACTKNSEAYTNQFKDLPTVLLLDHRQLLEILEDPDHPAKSALNDRAHIIIDDASMLEDTASKAFGWYCPIEYVRAGAEGNSDLTSFTDALQIWIEKTRNQQDVHELNRADLSTSDVTGLKERLTYILEETTFASPVESLLNQLNDILNPDNLSGRIAWIEQRNDGTQFIQSIPEFVNEVLHEHLYGKFPTTLLIPPQSTETLAEILTKSQQTTSVETERSPLDNVPIKFEEKAVEDYVKKPMGDRSIILLPSKRLIEDCFIKYTEQMEEKGVTLICQNLSGGLERMQAEFETTKTPCIWILTPWTYEGVTLPPEHVDHLVIQSLPFDHPGNMLFSTRSAHYQNGFESYSLPRLEHRLFRLLRTFCRHRTEDGGVTILDKRLREKKYGERIKEYLEKFAAKEAEEPPQMLGVRKVAKKKVVKKKVIVPASEDQMMLF